MPGSKIELPIISIVIVTRGSRWDELLQCIESCLLQDYNNLEILIYDDASEGDFSERFLNKYRNYPNIKYHRSIKHVGYTPLINKGYEEAAGEYIFILDDDAYYVDNNTISSVIPFFKKYPNMALAVMPFIQPGSGQNAELQPLESNGLSPPAFVAEYMGAVHAVRREAALAVNGYRDIFINQGEEGDLSIRLMEKGWDVIRVPAPVSVHLFSPKRDWTSLHILGPRNAILFNFLNVPFPFVVTRLFINTIGVLWHGFKTGNISLKIIGLAQGYGACIKYIGHRQAVSIKTWHRFRRLQKTPEPVSIP